jgi:hypothetical protein
VEICQNAQKATTTSLIQGYRHVTVSEPSAERRGFIDGLQLGFKTTEPKGIGEDYDVVVDCSGSVRAIQVYFRHF